MEIVAFALAIVAIVAAVVLFLRSRQSAQEALAAQAALEAQVQAEAERTKVNDTKVAALEAERDEAVARRDEKAVTKALWELELERTQRQWADVVVPDEALPTADGTNGERLTFALRQEVERLREEVGVAIRFDGVLDVEFDPEVALGALRISAELLSVAAKLCDEVVVSLDADAGEARVTTEMFGWDEDEAPQRAAADLEVTAVRVQATLVWEDIDEDGVRARLTLPVVEAADA